MSPDAVAGPATPGRDSPGITPVVQLRDLAIAFPEAEGQSRPVVRGLSLEIAHGEALGLVGRSGSGKSLTALSLLGLVPRPGRVTAGVMRVAGRDLLSLDAAGWRELRGGAVGMVFQEPSTALNPSLTVGHQLLEPLEVHRPGDAATHRKRVLSLLDEVELGGDPALLDRYPHQFSGGQRQRLILAMALAAGPDLLVADEPTTALDVTTQARLVALMDRLRRRHGMAVLWITHDLAVAAQVADRIAVLHDGGIVEDAPTGQLLRTPAHPVTRDFLAAARWEAATPAAPSPPRSDPGAGAADRFGDAPGSSTPLLSVRELVFRYPDRRRRPRGRNPRSRAGDSPPPALEGVSLDVRAGETVAVVGESGSGKSTLARLVVGLREPDRGTLEFRGEAVDRRDRRRHRALSRQVQMIFQDPFGSLDPRLRVEAVIREPLDIHGLETRAGRPARVARLLEEVGLEPAVATRFPHQLSGGERQRVALARALATEPSLLVADEPVTALDAPVQRTVMALLDRLRRQKGMACLLVAHDLATVREVADRVLVLHRGRIVEEGPADRLFAAPTHPVTRALVEAIPRLPGPGPG